MIKRYSLPEMEKIWSEETRFNKMFLIELTVCEVMANKGLIPKSAYRNIKTRAKIDISRIHEIEKVTKHDVIAFIEQISENIGPDSRYIHLGLTSSDILDTATALQLKDSCNLIITKLKNLSTELKSKSIKYKNTLTIGRTHGIHAEPTTFGLKLLGWYSEINRNIELMEFTADRISYGKISGAVGNFAHFSPDIEEYVCKKLGLKSEPVSTQVIPRDRYALYLSVLAIIASSLERFVTEVRHLQKTEVNELQEPFSSGQKGSSAMPHKRNPILSENICGLARLIRAYVQTALENIPLWHERDISHSSAERIILPDASILIDFILTRVTYIINGMVVNESNMLKNLRLTKGLIFSERVLLALIKKGLTRKQSYELVQSCAFKSMETDTEFKEVLLSDKNIKKYLTESEIEHCFDIKEMLSNINHIYRRTIKN